MLDRPNALHSIGMTQEGGLLKVAYISQKGGKPYLNQIFEIKLLNEGEGKDVKPLYMRKEGAALHELFDKSIIVTGLDAQQVLTRGTQVELQKDADIDAVIGFQAEPLLPYPVEESVVDWVKVKQDKEGTDLTILAAKHEDIAGHLEKWHSLAVEPEVVSCVPAALASFSHLFSPDENPIYAVDIGLSSTSCIVAENGKLVATQSSLKGVHSLFEAFTLDEPSASIELFYSLDFAHVEEAVQPNLYKAISRLRTDISKTLFSLRKQTSMNGVSTILITGVGGVIRSLANSVCEGLHLKVLLPEENSQFSLPPSQLQRYAIPIGYALSGLPKNGTKVDFRQESLAYPDPWKRLRKPLIVYSSLMLALAVSLFFFGRANLAKQEDQLRRDYAELLTTMQKPFSELEKEFEAKTGVKSGKSLTELSEEDLQFRLQFISQESKTSPDFFPLRPQVPLVSDVLAWLNTHPKIIGEDPNNPKIRLEGFNYKMVKRPEKKKLREKYRVKVELEISTDIPRYAREFYDSLIAPNEMIDPNIEVKWNPSRGNYRTTFFLKDKTVYP